MIALGFDPDLHASAWAALYWDPTKPGCRPHLIRGGIIRVSDSLKEREAAIAMAGEVGRRLAGGWLSRWLTVAAVEGQKHRRTTRRGMAVAQPNDLINLAMVSGAAIPPLNACLGLGAEAKCPMPHEWKGSVPKPIHQMRICERMGWKGKRLKAYARPEDFGDNPPAFQPERVSDWKHLMDAIGLALWAAGRA